MSLPAHTYTYAHTHAHMHIHIYIHTYIHTYTPNKWHWSDCADEQHDLCLSYSNLQFVCSLTARPIKNHYVFKLQQLSGHNISKYNNNYNNNDNNKNHNNKIYALQLLGSVCPIWWEVTNNLKTYYVHYPYSANVDWSDHSDIQAFLSLRCACTWFCQKWCSYRTLFLSLCLLHTHTHTHAYIHT